MKGCCFPAVAFNVFSILIVGSLGAYGKRIRLCNMKRWPTCGKYFNPCEETMCGDMFSDVESLIHEKDERTAVILSKLLEENKSSPCLAVEFVRNLLKSCGDRSDSIIFASFRRYFRQIDYSSNDIQSLLVWSTRHRLSAVLNIQVKPDQKPHKMPAIWIDSPSPIVSQLADDFVSDSFHEFEVKFLFHPKIKLIIDFLGLKYDVDSLLIHEVVKLDHSITRRISNGTKVTRALRFRVLKDVFHVDLLPLVNNVSEALDSSAWLQPEDSVVIRDWQYFKSILHHLAPDPANNPNTRAKPPERSFERTVFNTTVLALYMKIHFAASYAHLLFDATHTSPAREPEVAKYWHCFREIEETVPDLVARLYMDVFAREVDPPKDSAIYFYIMTILSAVEESLLEFLIASSSLTKNSGDLIAALIALFQVKHKFLYPKIVNQSWAQFDDEYDFGEVTSDMTALDLIIRLKEARNRADYNLLNALAVGDRLEWTDQAATSITFGYSQSWPTIYMPLGSFLTGQKSFGHEFRYLRLAASAGSALCSSSLGFFISLPDFKDIDAAFERFVNETYILADDLKAQLKCHRLRYNINSRQIDSDQLMGHSLVRICDSLAAIIVKNSFDLSSDCTGPVRGETLPFDHPYLAIEYAVRLNRLLRDSWRPKISRVRNHCEIVSLAAASQISRQYNCTQGSKLKPKQHCPSMEEQVHVYREICRDWSYRTNLHKLRDVRALQEYFPQFK